MTFRIIRWNYEFPDPLDPEGIVGKAIYEATPDYQWDLNVNVVNVLFVGDLTLSGTPFQDVSNPTVIWSADFMNNNYAASCAPLAGAWGPRVNGTVTDRGKRFIEYGFIQIGKANQWHSVYQGLGATTLWRINEVEDGQQHLDRGDDDTGWPWYSPTAFTSAADAYTIVFKDAPRGPATDAMVQTYNASVDLVDRFDLQDEFDLYFAARTIEEVNDAHLVFNALEHAKWHFDGSGLIDAGEKWYPIGGVTGNYGRTFTEKKEPFDHIAEPFALEIPEGDTLNEIGQRNHWRWGP